MKTHWLRNGKLACGAPLGRPSSTSVPAVDCRNCITAWRRALAAARVAAREVRR